MPTGDAYAGARERFVAETGFDVAALREATIEAHDIDHEIAPVAWGECTDYSRRTNAAIVTDGAVAAAGASASDSETE